MLQPHQLTLTTSTGGKIEIHVVHKDRVPDLLSRFSQAVQRRAARWLRWPSSYERRVWRACKGMPWWARATVRQHLLHDRATRIQARLDRIAEKQRLRQERVEARAARVMARQQVQEWGPTITTAEHAPAMELDRGRARTAERPTRSDRGDGSDPAVVRAVVPAPRPRTPRIGGARQATGSALGSVVPGRLTLTQRLAQEHGMEPHWPASSKNVLDHSRGR